VKSWRQLVVGRLIHSGGDNSDKHGHRFSLCDGCVEGGYSSFLTIPSDGMER
jgi:hypothetical protein